MAPSPPDVALLYDDSAYVETLAPVQSPGAERPVALVGRQVAGREFLDSYLEHGAYNELIGVVWNQPSADSLRNVCRRHPRAAQRPLRIVPVDRFCPREPAGPAAPLLYTPCPSDASFAWMRFERAPGAFSLCGVTHTLCTAAVIRSLGDLLTAPFESHDALICTSRAVVDMVKAVTGAYAAFLGERFGCNPVLRPRLELIPLGVNPERYRPATAEERSARRAELNIQPGAVAVLFVGRFTPHAKAHPFPMLQGLARAAKTTGQPVHLILSGWAANDGQKKSVVAAMRDFAPGLPVSIVNGLDPRLRFEVWQAADIFTSLADSVQETFGLVVVEAMACGLPVVASDWDGYRDLVVSGETGLLVPTYMVEDATVETTLRLLLGAMDYDHFLAECNQAAIVDVDAAAEAYAALIRDAALRRRLGAAGRERVKRRFTWQRVVAAYERLWSEQEAERVRAKAPAAQRPLGPPNYPAPEVSFAGYPTAWLRDNDRLRANSEARDRLPRILGSSVCNYGRQRIADAAILTALLDEARTPRLLSELTAFLGTHGADRSQSRATLAWLMKYGLLQRA
jgi:glycosyltransferase involved in cell wall biosynthesis